MHHFSASLEKIRDKKLRKLAALLDVMSLYYREVFVVLDKKNITNEVGRWTRVGILSITTVAPLINVVATRLREEQKKEATSKVSAHSGNQKKNGQNMLNSQKG